MARNPQPEAPAAEPALFRVLRRLKVQHGAEVVDVLPGAELDCSGWATRPARAAVEIGQLLPLNLAAQEKINPGAFRDRRPYTPPSAPPAIAVCGDTFRGPAGEALLCGRIAGHDGPHSR